MERYNQYSRGQLIQKIEFLKAYIRDSKEFKEFNKWIKSEFGGTEREVL